MYIKLIIILVIISTIVYILLNLYFIFVPTVADFTPIHRPYTIYIALKLYTSYLYYIHHTYTIYMALI